MPKQIAKTELSPERMLNSFTNNVENLMEFVQGFAPIAASHDNVAMKELAKLKTEIGEILSRGTCECAPESETALEYIAKSSGKNKETIEKIIDITKEYRMLPWLKTERTQILYKSSLVMLSSYVDYLLSDIFRWYHKTFPDSISDKDLSLSLSELKDCADKDEALDLILNKKLYALAQENLEKQKSYLKNYLKIDLNETMINWEIINEVIERRNIIVHNDCIVNRRYLKNVDYSRIYETGLLKNQVSIKEGQRLGVTDNYFRRVCVEILFAGIVLLQTCWRKWAKNEIEKADRSLISIMFDLGMKENFFMLEKLGMFSKQIETDSSENRYTMDFLYLISLKKLGKKTELQRELDKIDKSALRPLFLAALSAINDDRTNFYENIRKAAAIGDIRKLAFTETPLFPLLNEFAKDADFQQRIEQIFSAKPS